MLEIFLIYYLAKKIGLKVEAKGYTKRRYVVMFVLMWVLGEIVGAMFGIAKTGEVSIVTYLYTLLGAATGAVTAFVMVNNLTDKKETEMTQDN